MHSSAHDGRTLIRIGGGAASKNKEEPLCSVPIQTTAKLSIHWRTQTGAAYNPNGNRPMGSGSPTVIRSPRSTGSGSECSRSVSSGRLSPSAASIGTMTSVATSSTSGANTAPRSSVVIKSSSVSEGSSETTDSTSVCSYSGGRLSPSVASIGTMTSLDDTRTFEPVSSNSVTSLDSTESHSDNKVVQTDSVAAPNDITIGGGCGTETASVSSEEKEIRVTSTSYTVDTDEAISVTSGGRDDEHPGTSELVADASQSTSHQFPPRLDSDAASGTDSAIGGCTAAAEELDGSSSGGGGSEYGEMTATMKRSTFNFLGWDIMNEIGGSSRNEGCHRVVVFKDPSVVLMFKATCATEKAGNDSRLLDLLADIAENCAKRLQRMKDITLPNLSAQHIDTLPLHDGRTTGDHLTEISAALGETVTIADVAYRFHPPENVYVGTSVQSPIVTRSNYTIGKVGIIVVLTKKNKYATVEAFSEQLCQHIAQTRPATLGSFVSDRLSGRASQRRAHLERDQLLLQGFLFDPTIVVAEAARRCFVVVEDFLLFG